MNNSSNELRLKLISTFLFNRGWMTLNENNNFIKLKPPPTLEMENDYSITIPKQISAPDFEEYIKKIIRIICEFYPISEDTLFYLTNEESTILTLRFIDSKTSSGSMPFVDFDNLIEYLKKIFADTFTFIMTDLPTNEKTAEEAINFLRYCNFLQTELGSYVTKIQLPNKYIVKDPTFFDPAGVVSKEISNRINNLLKFIVERVFKNDDTIYTNEFLEDNSDLININVLEDLANLFSKIEMNEINFNFHSIDSIKEIPSGKITVEKKLNFINYINFVREKLTETIDLNVVGKIVELRSRNPESNHNYILVSSIIEGHKNYLAAILNNDNYAKAILAHKNNRDIRIKGKAKKLKTQYKILTLEEIVIV